MENEFKKFDRVIVSAAATGLGVDLHGWVEDVHDFMGLTYVSVKYSEPSPDGRWGITLTNLGMIRKDIR